MYGEKEKLFQRLPNKVKLLLESIYMLGKKEELEGCAPQPKIVRYISEVKKRKVSSFTTYFQIAEY